MGHHHEKASAEGTAKKRKHRHHRHSEHHAKESRPAGALQQAKETPVEKPVVTRARSNAVRPGKRPDLEVISNPEWYVGIKSRLNEFGQYSNAFAGTKETLGYTADLSHLDAIETGAQMKKLHLDALFSTITQFHEDMKKDPGNREKKEEGEELYNTCCTKMRICEEHYKNLMTALTERRQTVQREVKAMKRGSIRARLQALSKDSPMMQLIRRVKAMESGAALSSSGIRTTKTKGLMDLLPKSASEALNQLNEVKEQKESVEEDKEGAEKVKKFIEGVKAGKMEEEEEGGLKEKITDGIEMVKGIADTVKEAVDAFRNYSKMSDENKTERLVNLISNGVKTALDAGTYITGLLKEVPILGGIVGLIKNVITFFQKGFEVYQAKKREKAMKEARKTLKEKMYKRQRRYAGDADLRGLYTQVERDAEGNVHMTAARKKEDQKNFGRERRGLDGTAGGANRDIMRQNAARRREDPAAKRAYYTAKARETQAQYDEMKEASYRQKNITVAAVGDIIQEGISVVANIASFIPGVGTLVKAGAEAANAGVSFGRKAVSKGRAAWKNRGGGTKHLRSDVNKEKFRTKYAENIYSSLADVSRFVNPEGSLTIDDTKLDEVKRVEDSYHFAENLLTGAGADMPALINSESKDELLENMSSMFAREG